MLGKGAGPEERLCRGGVPSRGETPRTARGRWKLVLHPALRPTPRGSSPVTTGSGATTSWAPWTLSMTPAMPSVQYALPGCWWSSYASPASQLLLFQSVGNWGTEPGRRMYSLPMVSLWTAINKTANSSWRTCWSCLMNSSPCFHMEHVVEIYKKFILRRTHVRKCTRSIHESTSSL